jgi:hypothetical protein
VPKKSFFFDLILFLPKNALVPNQIDQLVMQLRTNVPGCLNRREKEKDFSASSAPQANEGSGCESKNVLNPPDDHAIVVWGTGNARREFLHVDDLADACLTIMENWEDPEHINVGAGKDLAIREIVFPEAHVVYDSSKPDGTAEVIER